MGTFSRLLTIVVVLCAAQVAEGRILFGWEGECEYSYSLGREFQCPYRVYGQLELPDDYVFGTVINRQDNPSFPYLFTIYDHRAIPGGLDSFWGTGQDDEGFIVAFPNGDFSLLLTNAPDTYLAQVGGGVWEVWSETVAGDGYIVRGVAFRSWLIPEPTTLVLFAVAALAAVTAGRRNAVRRPQRPDAAIGVLHA